MSTITKRQMATRFAILASTRYVFEQPKGSTTLSSAVVAERTMQDGLIVLAVNHGMIAFDFKDTPLGAFELLESAADGLVPDEVTASLDAFLEFQGKRLRRAVFVAACVYGRHAQLTHSSVLGPRYPGLDQIYNWVRDANSGELLLPKPDHDRFLPRLGQRLEALKKGASWLASIPKAHFDEGIELADRLLAANASNAVVDNEALLVMNYQAAVLHSRQHAGASLALSAISLEGALEELFHVYGLVKGSIPCAHATKAHTCAPISKSDLKKLTFKTMTDHLRAGGLLDAYLADRIDRARIARNALMHRGEDAASRQSGEALTAVRDVLRLCTGEEFELLAAFSYRM